MHVCNNNVSKYSPDDPESMTWHYHQHKRSAGLGVWNSFSVVYLCVDGQAASSIEQVGARGQPVGVDSLHTSHGPCSYSMSRCFWRRHWRKNVVGGRDLKVSLENDSSNVAGFLTENSKERSHFRISSVLKSNGWS